MPTLDDRKSTVLQAIVRSYVREGEPVGSKRIVAESGLAVSAATVRADMSALEDAGLIAQPHTSAGRVPTDRGYRHFVDTMSPTEPLTPSQRAAVEGLLGGARDLEDLLRRTSGVLSQLTRYAAMVVTPRIDRARLRHVELVTLGPTAVLAVLIADTGRVDKQVLDVRAALTDDDVARARHAINSAVEGLRPAAAGDVLDGVASGAPSPLDALIEACADAVRGIGADDATEQVLVGGTGNIAEAGYFDRLDQVKAVVEALEEQVVVLDVLRDALDRGDPAVRIGAELPLVELAACSVVAARYEGAARGSVGVIGPSRMDYPRTLAAVQAVASSLERALGELSGDRDGDG